MKKRLSPDATAMLELPSTSILEDRPSSRRPTKRSTAQGVVADEQAAAWRDRHDEDRRQLRIDAAPAVDETTINEPVIRAHRVVFAMGPSGSLQVVVF